MTTQTTEPRPMKPYLINAVLDYCRDTGTTPYVMVAVIMPAAYRRNTCATAASSSTSRTRP